MPLPKSFMQPQQQSSRSAQTRRKACSLCHNLDPRGHPNSVYQSESSKEAKANLTLVLDTLTLSKTRAPTDGGCRFCYVLAQALDAFVESWRGARQRAYVELKEKTSIKIGMDGEKWKGEAVEIYATSASRVPWPTLGTAHHIPTNAGSDETFEFARSCIKDCLTNPKHEACKPMSMSSSYISRRLLDVGRVKSPIRLIDTQGKSFQYAALSHRWGAGPNLTATKSNWHEMASSISFDSLPPLFQDAIIITRQMGLRYLWIDSLCIIQDSVRDWETESSKMGGIYENSYFTISATDCSDGNARCLVDRRKPVKIRYENTTGKEFNIIARRVLEHHPNVKDKEPAKPSGPLTSRAWALQEHVLSTRILHYTQTELLFECRSSYRCECLPARKTYPTTPSLIPKAVTRRSGAKHSIWEAWQRIVEQYSRRDLTVPNDKLPAISGVASKIKQATNSAYIAGLWKDNLASELLWSASPKSASDTASYVLETYRAPSFSWASLNVPITYYVPDEDERESFTSMINLQSSSVTLAGLNTLGAVSGASLKVRGPCLPALLSSTLKDGKWEYTLLIRGTSAIPLSQDCLLVEEACESSSDDKMGTTVRRAKFEAEMSPFKASVMCLSVARYDTWISGLVLGQSGRIYGAWLRLGTFAAGFEAFRKAEEKLIHIL